TAGASGPARIDGRRGGSVRARAPWLRDTPRGAAPRAPSVGGGGSAGRTGRSERVSTPESVLLRRIAERSAHLVEGMRGVLEIGPGDDCAALRLPPGATLLTVDQLVEGRHYTPDTALDLVARKCVARSVSDIAAMGGTPVAALATGALRDAFDREDELFRALHRWADAFGCPLVGGDIARTPGPTVLTCTV